MAYKNGTASDYLDLLDIFRRYVAGYGTAAAPVAGGGNVGDGTVGSVDTLPATVTETWTLTCTKTGTPAAGGSNVGDGTVTGVSGTASTVTETWTLTCTAESVDGGTFSVVGSVSGAQADATVGTPYSNTYLNFTINDGAEDFDIGDTFTIEANADGDLFFVSGSVSGDQADATVGVAYSNAYLLFTITDGATDFAEGDTFTIATTIGDMSAAGEAWVEQRWTGGNELILQAPGVSGLDEIYVGIKGYSDVPSDYYNWELRGYQGYNDPDAFDAQPNTSPARYLPLWDSSIPYWLVCNGDRAVLVAKVSTIYELMYLGKVQAYGTPSQYPYPVLIAGGTGTEATRWSSTLSNHSNLTWPDITSGDNSSAVYCHTDNSWIALDVAGTSGNRNFFCPPAYNRDSPSGSPMDFIDVNPDGSYTIEPLRLVQETPSDNLVGELDAIGFVTGQSNAAENLVTIGGTDWLVVPNINRSGRSDYCAVKLA